MSELPSGWSIPGNWRAEAYANARTVEHAEDSAAMLKAFEDCWEVILRAAEHDLEARRVAGRIRLYCERAGLDLPAFWREK